MKKPTKASKTHEQHHVAANAHAKNSHEAMLYSLIGLMLLANVGSIIIFRTRGAGVPLAVIINTILLALATALWQGKALIAVLGAVVGTVLIGLVLSLAAVLALSELPGIGPALKSGEAWAYAIAILLMLAILGALTPLYLRIERAILDRKLG